MSCLTGFSAAASKGNGPGWGPRGEAGTQNPGTLPATHPSPARALSLYQADPTPEETKQHPLTSEVWPMSTCLLASARYLKKRSQTGYFHLFHSRLLESGQKAMRLLQRC